MLVHSLVELHPAEFSQEYEVVRQVSDSGQEDRDNGDIALDALADERPEFAGLPFADAVRT